MQNVPTVNKEKFTQALLKKRREDLGDAGRITVNVEEI